MYIVPSLALVVEVVVTAGLYDDPILQSMVGEIISSIYAASVGGDDRTFGIRVGTLRQREQLVPRRQFWCRSQLPWLPALPGEAFEG